MAGLAMAAALVSAMYAQAPSLGLPERGAVSQRQQADAALEARDYERAARLLTALAVANPKDVRVLFDLGSAQDALDQSSAAETSYRAAIAIDAKYLEPHVALGLLLARGGRMDAARDELAAVKTVASDDKPLQARAYRALARIDEKMRPVAARDELLEALKLTPETPEDILLGAELAEAANNGSGAAEQAYRRYLATVPNDPTATAALAHLLVKNLHAADAETLLVEALKVHPENTEMTVQLASIYAHRGEQAKAIPLLETLHAAAPLDANLGQLLARLYLDAGDYAKAEPMLQALAAANPHDPTLVDDRARALFHLKRFAEAQQILARIVANPTGFQSPADLGNAAGDLAFAASSNGDPETALRAIEVRATVSPTSAAVLFLTAISHDKLHHVKLAVEAYKAFLVASKGSNPDEEFEARHRLIALEHMK
jgi:tetratricopeptide (TPR) repeat protein